MDRTFTRLWEMLPTITIIGQHTGAHIRTLPTLERDAEFEGTTAYYSTSESWDGFSHKSPEEAVGRLVLWCYKKGYLKEDE